MAENYKHLYEQMKKIVAMYQDDIVPRMRKEIEDLEKKQIKVRCKVCRFCKKHPTSDKVKMCTNEQQWVTECYPLVNDNDFCSYGERKDNG